MIEDLIFQPEKNPYETYFYKQRCWLVKKLPSLYWIVWNDERSAKMSMDRWRHMRPEWTRNVGGK